MTIASAPDEHELDARRDRIRWRRLVVLAIAVVVMLAFVGAGIGWWFLGGAHLQVGAPDGGATTTVGIPRNFGIELNSTGGEVRLVTAKVASLPEGLTASFVASDLMDVEDGNLAATRIASQPLRGLRVRGQGLDNSRFLTLVINARHEGMFHLHDIEITYKAGARTRHVRAHMDQCILAFTPAHKARGTNEITRAMEGINPVPPTDLLVAEYVDCIQH